MSEIRFYHLERQPVDTVLPALVSKAFENGHRIIIKAKDEQDVARFNELLWTFSQSSFLPHGSAKDGHAEKQPIWMTHEDENPNKADVLIRINGADCQTVSDFALCCDVFDGRDEQILSAARTRWKTYKDADLNITYWQQGDKGWEKKA